jgi:prepilin-type N-terminal cleavage/methylation domain-containing protein
LTKTLSATRRTAGFTLIEVMAASLILVVGFIGLIKAVALASNTMDHARRQTLATQIIIHQIEDLRLSSWTTVSALPTASTAITIDGQFDQARLALGDDKSATAIVSFSLARTVTNPDPVTNIREVNFTVTWVVTTSRVDANGNRLTFTYTRANSAWFGKYGLNLTYQRS